VREWRAVSVKVQHVSMQVGTSDVCDVGEAINLETQSASVEFAALG
jgi:hypothetical protein